VLFSTAHPAIAADSVSGTWDVTLAGAVNSKCIAALRKQGKNVTGNLTCPQVGLRLPIKASVSGSGMLNTTSGDIGWTASMNGGVASGTYQGALGAGSWTAQKAQVE
jgi:hypothetical protein